MSAVVVMLLTTAHLVAAAGKLHHSMATSTVMYECLLSHTYIIITSKSLELAMVFIFKVCGRVIIITLHYLSLGALILSCKNV